MLLQLGYMQAVTCLKYVKTLLCIIPLSTFRVAVLNNTMFITYTIISCRPCHLSLSILVALSVYLLLYACWK